MRLGSPSASTTRIPTALAAATTRIADGLDRWVAKGRIDAQARAAAVASLIEAPSIADAVGDASIVIEATLEDPDVKDAVFRAIDAAAPPGADPGHEHELALGRGASSRDAPA